MEFVFPYFNGNDPPSPLLVIPLFRGGLRQPFLFGKCFVERKVAANMFGFQSSAAFGSLGVWGKPLLGVEGGLITLSTPFLRFSNTLDAFKIAFHFVFFSFRV